MVEFISGLIPSIHNYAADIGIWNDDRFVIERPRWDAASIVATILTLAIA